MWRSKISFLLALILLAASFGVSMACSIPPTMEQRDKSFRTMMEKADHVFLGRVSHVLRRRWNDDDTPPRFPDTFLEIARKHRAGEDVGSKKYIANWVEFAEATAYIIVDTELFYSGLTDGRRDPWSRVMLPIDLLRPFHVAGHGPCNSFPQTCPWDIEVGEKLVLAVAESEYGPHKALICKRVGTLSFEERDELRRSNNSKTKYDAIIEFLDQRPGR